MTPRSGTLTISASAVLPAPAETLYRIIADYRDGHPRILPRPPFVSLDVEEGGCGEGTVISVKMRVAGMVQKFRAHVTEPEPGRVLVETTDTGYVTTFTVEPGSPGEGTRVTIHSVLTPRPGLLGRIEAWTAPRMLRPVFERELALLGEVAGKEAG